MEQVDRKLQEANKPISIKTLADIQMVIRPYLMDQSYTDVSISTKLEWKDEESKQSGVDNVVGKTSGMSMQRLLIEGLDTVKKRMEGQKAIEEATKCLPADNLPSVSLPVWDIDKMRFNVDNLIERKLGGKRQGLRIRWCVTEGVYEFDPYARKLYKVEEK
jgi:hypothetical protein